MRQHFGERRQPIAILAMHEAWLYGWREHDSEGRSGAQLALPIAACGSRAAGLRPRQMCAQPESAHSAC
jgi:hypothetical protein